MQTVVFAPGAVTAGNNIDLPSGSPSIGKIISAEIFRGSDATNPASKVSVTATKVDRNTITLDTDTADTDLLILRYYAEGEIRTP